MPSTSRPLAPRSEPEVLTLIEASKFLRVCDRTLRRWMHGPRPVPASRCSPFKILFIKEDLFRWLREQTQTPTRTTPRKLRCRVVAETK